MKKKITNTLILLGIVGAIGSGAAFTSAYLINGDKAVNTMDATEVNVHIEEDFLQTLSQEIRFPKSHVWSMTAM